MDPEQKRAAIEHQHAAERQRQQDRIVWEGLFLVGAFGSLSWVLRGYLSRFKIIWREVPHKRGKPGNGRMSE